MNVKLAKASRENISVMENLMQFYIYDFSEYVNCEVEEDGLFAAYPALEDYWKEKNHKFPYVMLKDGKYIGFVLVRFIETAKRNYFYRNVSTCHFLKSKILLYQALRHNQYTNPHYP